MQTVDAAFTAAERAPFRQVAESLMVSWHRQSIIGNRTFTIGVSVIGGNDVIGQNVGAIGSPSNYKYFDESTYVISMNWERGYQMPIGGLSSALGDATLDNTSGRFTPRYMGGRSELSTAIQPSKPVMISGGFQVGGVSQTLPQFAGLIAEQPLVDIRSGSINLKLQDYVYYFQNKKLDTAIMFTAQRTDQVLATLMAQLGMSTAQYDLDYGINVIPFGKFDAGVDFASIVGDLVQAENGHFYQDESGIFKFENRQHWDSAPYTTVQKVITTAHVINSQAPDQSHLVNVVEINGQIITKQQSQLLFQLSAPLAIPAGGDATLFVNFDDPVLQVQSITGFSGNTQSDASGTDITTSLSISSTSIFAQAAKVVFHNSSAFDGFVTQLYIYGRPAKKSADLYYRARDDSSVTAYQEQVLTIDNPFIQNQSWAQSLAQMILNDYSNVENIQRITIRAFPELQLGDLISWQGRYWRIFDIKTALDPSVGYTQELTLLQRTITSYFRIGISTIGGSHQIAP